MAPLSLTTLPDGVIQRICRLSWRPRGSPHPRRHPALAALAATCRRLSEPALDVLWHSLASLVPLAVYTLPKDLCAVVSAADTRTCSYVKYRLELLRDPLPEDFIRFSTYASRVKVFSYNCGAAPFDRYQIPSDFWARLLRHGPKPLLPNIENLRHRETDYEYRRVEEFDRGPVYRAELLLGPGLKEADVDYGGWPQDEQRPNEIVIAMSRSSPRIEILELSGGGHLYAYCHMATEATLLSSPETALLLHLVKLHTFRVHVTPPALAGLASLVNLRELHISVNPLHYDWDALPHEGCGPFFPALAILKLYHVPFEWAIALIRSMTSSSLWRVAITDAEDEAASDIALYALCASLGEHPSFRTLQAISIYTGKRGFVAPKIYRPQHIAPLLSLPAMRLLAICGNCQVIIDDYLLHDISWVWPNLESLELSFQWPSSAQGLPKPIRMPGDADYPRATLHGLLRLAWHCPRLATLELAVDLRWIPDFDTWPSPPVSLRIEDASPLKTFDTNGSVFQEDDTLLLATFFSLVFPRMESLRSPSGTTWPRMEEHYWRFLRIRRQERGLLRRTLRPREPAEPYISTSYGGYHSDSESSAESLPVS